MAGFNLGLGSQVQPHIEKRFSMPWSHPVRRMREFVLAMQEIWSCWRDGTKLRFEGDFYTHKLMTPMFTPEPQPYEFPKVFIAAVGEAMTEMCGEVADGTARPRVHDQALLRGSDHARIAARNAPRPVGSEANSRCRAPVFVVTENDEAELSAAAVGTRKQIAFYGSTPAYRKVLELHGWGGLHDELHRLSRQGDWDAMGALIDDEVLDEFAVVAPLDEVAAKIRDRCDGVIDRVLVGFPSRQSRRTPSSPFCRNCAANEGLTEEVPVTTRCIDEAAKVFADPMSYTDEAKLHAALSSFACQRPGVLGGGARTTGRSGRSPSTPTSWRSSGPTPCSPTRRVPC